MDLFDIVLLSLCILNCLVSISLARRDDLDITQKIAQIVVVWIIPFIGAAGLWIFHRSQDLPVKKDRRAFGGGPNDSIGGSAGES